MLNFLGNLYLRLQVSGCVTGSSLLWVVTESWGGNLCFLHLLRLLCAEAGTMHQLRLCFYNQPLTESLLFGSPLIPGPQRSRYKERYNSMHMLMGSAEPSSSFLPNKTSD